MPRADVLKSLSGLLARPCAVTGISGSLAEAALILGTLRAAVAAAPPGQLHTASLSSGARAGRALLTECGSKASTSLIERRKTSNVHGERAQHAQVRLRCGLAEHSMEAEAMVMEPMSSRLTPDRHAREQATRMQVGAAKFPRERMFGSMARASDACTCGQCQVSAALEVQHSLVTALPGFLGPHSSLMPSAAAHTSADASSSAGRRCNLARGYASNLEQASLTQSQARLHAHPHQPSTSAAAMPGTQIPGVKKTFYKRHLPTPPCTAFASPEGRVLFQEALADGTMAGFFKLMEQFSTQDEPAFCGLTSLSMVLNALAIDPRRIWKGAWRWFHEGMLDCCRPLELVKSEGITLEQASFLARCNGARVDTRYYDSFSETEFRMLVERVCSSGDEHLVVSYSRATLSQTGDGHFSPIGGYHRSRDQVLILDVARFKYPPHWVPLSLLYQAMSRIDAATGRPRGYMLMSAHHLLDSAMFTLDVRHPSWKALSVATTALPQMLAEHLQARAAGAAVQPASEVIGAALRHLLQALPLEDVAHFMVVREQAVGPADRCLPHKAREVLLMEFNGLPLIQAVQQELAQTGLDDVESLSQRVTLLLLLHQPSAWPSPQAWCDSEAASAWASLMDVSMFTIVAAEVAYLRQQFLHVSGLLKTGGPLDPQCNVPSCSHTHVLDCATRTVATRITAPVSALTEGKTPV
uniref:glutathione gamma-glutamylcysteinyltransferase n=1 Tax=Chlamydomonas euryale TaxID=1486919 RepID=A0A7R9VTY1_9CHLO